MGRRAIRLWFLLPLLFAAGCFGLFREPYGSLSGRVTIRLPGEAQGSSFSVASSSASGSAAPVRSGSAAEPLSTGHANSRAEAPEYIVYLRREVPDLDEFLSREGFRLVSSGEGYAVVEDTGRRTPGDVERTLLQYSEIAAVERNGILYPMALPEDPDLSLQWALFALRLPEAWEVTTGDRSVVVAVVDTGIDFSHPELNESSLWVPGWDFTGGGAGREYVYQPGDKARAGRHGTQVAGVIGRLSNNRIGGAGVAWRVRLMPLRVMDDGSGATFAQVAAAIRWAVHHGAHVINLSLGCDPRNLFDCPHSLLLLREIERARSMGVAVVAAAGNYSAGGGPVMSPANYPGVIAVGATDRESRRATYSGYGMDLDLVAPGGEGDACIHVPTSPGNGAHACVTGTSFAAPHVSGVIALMLAAGSARDGEEAALVLTMTARDLGAPGFDTGTGWGLVDAYAAVSAGVPVVFAAAEEPSGRLVAVGRTVGPGSGGFYRVPGVPEGRWKVVAWIDKDGDGALSAGDFFGEHPSWVSVARRAHLSGLDIEVTRYEGPRREVLL